MPDQYNYRSPAGKSGGMNMTTLTGSQQELIKLWSRPGYKASLPYMLLNHMTLAEQDEMVRVYQMIGLIGGDE